MSRQKGLFGFSGNFEPQIAEPLDGRLKVKTLEALLDLNTWTAKDGGLYIYKGMVVAVTDDPKEGNNGLYYLNNENDIHNIDSWINIFSNEDYATEQYVKNLTSTIKEDLKNQIDSKATISDIPTKLSQLENNINYITEDFINNIILEVKKELNDKINKIKIPTKLSQLDNDTGFIAEKDIEDIIISSDDVYIFDGGTSTTEW